MDKRRLVLAKETLVELTPGELKSVWGATNTCTCTATHTCIPDIGEESFISCLSCVGCGSFITCG